MENVGKAKNFQEIESVGPSRIALGVQDNETGVKVEEI